jgi:hypothetical protein
MQALICIKPPTTSQGNIQLFPVAWVAPPFVFLSQAQRQSAAQQTGRTSSTHGWENYFMFTGNGAVTLMGLSFVIVTLGVDRAQGQCVADEELCHARSFTLAACS